MKHHDLEFSNDVHRISIADTSQEADWEKTIKAIAQKNESYFLKIHISSSGGLRDFYEDVARELHFPQHFGKNYDAFYDCLTDLSHQLNLHTRKGYVIYLENFQANRTITEEEKNILYDIFKEAAQYWQNKKVHFAVYVR